MQKCCIRRSKVSSQRCRTRLIGEACVNDIVDKTITVFAQISAPAPISASYGHFIPFHGHCLHFYFSNEKFDIFRICPRHSCGYTLAPPPYEGGSNEYHTIFVKSTIIIMITFLLTVLEYVFHVVFCILLLVIYM